MIGAFRSAICSSKKLFPQASAAVPFSSVFLDRGHPRFGNFNSIIPVDVIREKCSVDSFLDPTSSPEED